MLTRVYPYFKPYQTQCLIALAALFGTHLVEAAIPLYLKKGIDLIAEQQTDIIAPFQVILFLTGLRFLLLNYGRRRNALVSTGLAGALRQVVYAHLLTLGRGFYARYSLGDLMARATNDIAAIQQFFRLAVHTLLSLVSIILIAPVFMWQQSHTLTLLLMPLMLGIGVVGWYLADQIRVASARQQSEYATLTDVVQQNLQGIRTIQAHAQEVREIKHFNISSNSYFNTVQQQIRLDALLNGAMLFGSGLMTLIVAGVGGSQVQQGVISIGTLTAFVLYLTMILNVVKICAKPIFSLLTASSATQRVFQLLDEVSEIVDVSDAQTAEVIRGKLTLSGVSYTYPAELNQANSAVDDISITIESGEKVVIMGTVGSGKSTLLRLFARQIEPTVGEITLDDRALNSIPLKQLRHNIGFVPQESFLFATTLRENISFDDPDRSEKIIWDAANHVQLGKTIEHFSAGLDTLIGERGVTLSGGQKQRTALARGLIRQPPVLLLDDCFSALDTETSALILAAIDERRATQTTIMVTHRVAHAFNADKILVMLQGRIIENGHHESLMAQNGYYAELVRSQEKMQAVT
jgi:ATP-binding cassette, subfamily B, multidrug efflux pump